MSMYCLYQLKDIPENKPYLNQTYEYVIANGGRVSESRYKLVYQGMTIGNTSATEVRKKIKGKPRRVFSNRCPGIGDVITLDREGETECYFLDEFGLVLIRGFFDTSAAMGTPLTADTINYRLSGKLGTWKVHDCTEVDGNEFFLLTSTEYGTNAANVLVDKTGHIIADDIRNDFDDRVMRLIHDHLHPAQSSVMPSIPKEHKVYPDTLGRNTVDFFIPGKQGKWKTIDTAAVDGNEFFLMENQKHGERVERIILSSAVKIVTEGELIDFDAEIIEKIRMFLYPESEEKNPLQEKQKAENSVSSGREEEQSDDTAGKSKDPKDRPSLRKRLKEMQLIVHGEYTESHERIK